MEQKNDLEFDQKFEQALKVGEEAMRRFLNPDPNARQLSLADDLSHHALLEGFEGVERLNGPETKVALRAIKSNLEKELGYEMTDELFVAIFKKVPYLKPARPLGSYSRHYGFVVPLEKILEAHDVPREKLRASANAILSFFNMGGRGFTIIVD